MARAASSLQQSSLGPGDRLSLGQTSRSSGDCGLMIRLQAEGGSLWQRCGQAEVRCAGGVYGEGDGMASWWPGDAPSAR